MDACYILMVSTYMPVINLDFHAAIASQISVPVTVGV